MPDEAIITHVFNALTLLLAGYRAGSFTYALSFYDEKQDLTISARDLGLMHIFEALDDEFYRVTKQGYLHVRHLFNEQDQSALDILYDDAR